MPRLNLAATHERRLQVTEETRRLLIAHDVQTPNYFPIIALIEMQKHVGYKPNSNTRTRRRQNPFSSTEMPRTIEGRITTPSWLRYANIDGQNQYYAAVLPGYHWDVEYYRCEDGSLITYPALAKLPELPVAPEKVKVELSDVTVRLHCC